MTYEVYKVTTEVTKENNRELYKACAFESDDADELVNEYVNENCDFNDYPVAVFDNLEDAKKEMTHTSWSYVSNTVPFIRIDYCAISIVDEEDESVDFIYSEC